MVELQKMIFKLNCPPVDTNGAAVTAASGYANFDSRNSNIPVGFVHCLIGIGNIAANISAGTMRIQESADGSTGWTDVTGLTFTDITAAAGDNTLYLASFPLGGTRLRYFRFNMTGGAGATLVFSVFIGERVNQAPTTDALRGVAQSKFITS